MVSWAATRGPGDACPRFCGQIHEVEPRGGELPPPGSSPQDRVHCSVKELYLLDHYDEAQVIRVQRIASQASKSNLDRQDVPLDPGSQNSLHCNTSHKEKARPQAPCLACLGPRRPKSRTEAHSESRKRPDKSPPTDSLVDLRSRAMQSNARLSHPRAIPNREASKSVGSSPWYDRTRALPSRGMETR